ncbi:MAG TPA: protein kinase, partial [Gemmataceae bacterium]|nr:protein kinase [Gemmataceae bacterium]
EAIEHAHAMGVVHCDLKPSNLLLRADGRVLVSDFGLARSLTGGGTARGGTAGFLAPEQADPDGTVSPRTDVYGLGAVLRTLVPEGLAEVDALCRRCLAAHPTERFASAAELASALRAVGGASPTTGSDRSLSSPTPPS